jgi:Flp pilus assembly protein TadD
MAEVELRKNEIPLSEHYASLSLDFNSTNLNALQLLAILYRKSGENDKANQSLESIRKIDPLGHFSDFESYLQDPSSDNLSRFSSIITNELQYQTYLELCIYYYDLGLKNEALSILEKSPFHPLVSLWKAFLSDDPSILLEASNTSPAFVFPYRMETVKALEWAVSKNTSWKFRYYLALNYAAINRMEEAMKLLRECGQEPDYAPFYLTRASMIGPGDEKGELADLLHAKRLAPDDWRVSARLIDYYRSNNDNQSALAEAKEAYTRNKDNTLLGIRYATALINTGQYSASLKALESMNILPNEGSSQGKELFEQACLFQSLELIKKNKYSQAIRMIEKSKEWPENLGVGKPFKPDIRIQDRLEAFCLEKLNRKAEADSLRKAGTDIMNNKYSRIQTEMQKIGIK